jgi:hypothetical protein
MMNWDGFVRIAVASYSIAHRLYGASEKNNKNSESGYPLFMPKFEPTTFGI